MEAPKGYRFERGLLWPDYDQKCARVVFKMASDLSVIMRYVAKPRVVVQAGGNCGVWPRTLSPMFGEVHTFEPDHMNFTCLQHNTQGLANVHRYGVGLGAKRMRAVMETPGHETDNCGALQIAEDDLGDVPVIPLDDLQLPVVDLLYLDIEGFEIPALYGAAETIAKCKPIIALEDKGLSARYGYEQGDVDEVLNRMGYKVVQRIHRDVVFAPR
jgi:FkbM family methyltransferase